MFVYTNGNPVNNFDVYGLLTKKTKAWVCKLLKNRKWHVRLAFADANRIRKELAPGTKHNQWNNPTFRRGDNFLLTAAFKIPRAAVVVHAMRKKSIFDWKTSPPDELSTIAGLQGVDAREFRYTKEDWKRWCNSCLTVPLDPKRF